VSRVEWIRRDGIDYDRTSASTYFIYTNMLYSLSYTYARYVHNGRKNYTLLRATQFLSIHFHQHPRTHSEMRPKSSATCHVIDVSLIASYPVSMPLRSNLLGKVRRSFFLSFSFSFFSSRRARRTGILARGLFSRYLIPATNRGRGTTPSNNNPDTGIETAGDYETRRGGGGGGGGGYANAR
jgi:hypothetical protein